MITTRHLALSVIVTGAWLAAGRAAHADPHAAQVYTLASSTHGNPEGIAVEPFTGAFYVGATGDGTIYRGTLGDPTVRELIPGGPGRSAIGLEIAHGKLYVAGGATGDIVVYDLGTRQQVALFSTGAGGFLNDLQVTERGDVYVTDSFRPTLWHVTGAQVRAGQGTPEAIDLAPEVVYTAGAFNANGIVALDDHTLLIVITSSGALVRIDLERNGRKIRQVEGVTLTGGDGMLLDRGRLVVVRNGTLAFVKLDHRATRGAIVGELTDPTFRGPSTVARGHNRFLLVNADFETSTPPFTVSSVSRFARDGSADLDAAADGELEIE